MLHILILVENNIGLSNIAQIVTTVLKKLKENNLFETILCVICILIYIF